MCMVKMRAAVQMKSRSMLRVTAMASPSWGTCIWIRRMDRQEMPPQARLCQPSLDQGGGFVHALQVQVDAFFFVFTL